MSGMEIIIRVLLTFVTMLIMTRIMGRKEISQMTFFNFVSAIAIGSIGANLAVNKQLSIGNGVLALILWGIVTILIDLVGLNSKKARVILEGDPKILIKNGEIVEDVMRKARLDLDALKSMLRQKNIFSVSDVDFAIFEIDGKLSVLKKEESLWPTKKDFSMPIPEKIFPLSTSVIMDGKIVTENLTEYNLDEDWLIKKLADSGISSVTDVFYAEVQKDGSLFIDTRKGAIGK